MNESGQIAVILNPKAAGDAYDAARIDRLRAIAGSRAVLFSIDEPERVHAVAEGIRERKAGVVAIVGGDGTVSSVLTALHRAYGRARWPHIAMLRGGTMNTVANAFGIPRGTPEELLARLLHGGARPVWPRATLEVEGRLGFLFSGGALVGFLDTLYSHSQFGKGPVGAFSLLSVASLQALTGGPLFRMVDTPLTATLRIDDNEHPERRYMAFAVGTVEQVGLGFRPFRLARECQDQFQIFAFHGSAQALVRELPKIYRGQPMTRGFGFDPLARKLEISTKDGEVAYALDGDVYKTTSPLQVRVGPKVEIVAL
jgi:diacylglycerol kinase family enzyme